MAKKKKEEEFVNVVITTKCILGKKRRYEGDKLRVKKSLFNKNTMVLREEAEKKAKQVEEDSQEVVGQEEAPVEEEVQEATGDIEDLKASDLDVL